MPSWGEVNRSKSYEGGGGYIHPLAAQRPGLKKRVPGQRDREERGGEEYGKPPWGGKKKCAFLARGLRGACLAGTEELP